MAHEPPPPGAPPWFKSEGTAPAEWPQTSVSELLPWLWEQEPLSLGWASCSQDPGGSPPRLPSPLPLTALQFSSVAQSCPTLCDPADCSTPSLPVHHQLLELTQTHVHWVSDAIQPSHSVVPFSSCLKDPGWGSFQMSQLFAPGGQSIGVSASTSVLPMNIQDWTFRTCCCIQTLTLQAHTGLGWVFSPQAFSESGLFKKCTILFYWSTVNLQGCVSFRCIAKGFGYMFTHIHSFLDSFPI